MFQTEHRITSQKFCIEGSNNKKLERRVNERHKKVGDPKFLLFGT
jgi:hypothetical protein